MLKTIAVTNDGKPQWGQDNHGNGESRYVRTLFDENGDVADDFAALSAAPIESDEGLDQESPTFQGNRQYRSRGLLKHQHPDIFGRFFDLGYSSSVASGDPIADG